MRFSDVAKGTLAERATKFTAYGNAVDVLLRPLSALEETDVAAAAIKYAKSKGSEPVEGHPIYEAALMANVLAIACMDTESPAHSRGVFFDGGADQVLRELDTDTLAELFQQQRIWQEQCSPTSNKKNVAELWEAAEKLAADDDPLVYARLSPRTRWILQRFTAALAIELRDSKVSSSSLSKTEPTETRKSEPSETSEKLPSDPEPLPASTT